MVIGIRGLRCAKVSFKEASSSREREDPRRDPSVNSPHVHGANSRHKRQINCSRRDGIKQNYILLERDVTECGLSRYRLDT